MPRPNFLPKFLISFFVFCCSLALLSACLKTGNDNQDDACAEQVSASDIEYSADIEPIVQNNCQSCHGSTPAVGRANLHSADCLRNLPACSHVNGSFAYGYDDVLQRINLPLSDSIHMPPNNILSGCDKAKLFRWKELDFP